MLWWTSGPCTRAWSTQPSGHSSDLHEAPASNSLRQDLGFSAKTLCLQCWQDKPKPHDIFEFYARHEAWLESNTQRMPIQRPYKDGGRSMAGLSKTFSKTFIGETPCASFGRRPDRQLERQYQRYAGHVYLLSVLRLLVDAFNVSDAFEFNDLSSHPLELVQVLNHNGEIINCFVMTN